MTRRPSAPTLQRIHALFSIGGMEALTDRQLLERFTAAEGEPAELAFNVIVERHGPMVLGVCKAVLGDEESARDAFQATLLILLRKAHSLWVQESLGPWLHRVAYREAQKVRSNSKRRQFHERRAAELRFACAETVTKGDDIAETLHEEIAHLPMRYRIPLVLCDLEGHTHEAASRHLGCPIGTIKSRLARGRERLRDRMTRRGFALSLSAIADHSSMTARSVISEALSSHTLEIVKEMGRSAAGHRSTANLLARELQRTMVQIRLTMIAAFAMTIASLTFGVGAITRQDKGVPTATNAVPSRTMTIHVVDRDGRPLIAARVFKNHVYKLPGNDRSLIENQDLRTDAGDSVTIPLSGTTVDLRVWASRTGFIPLHAMWAKQFQPDGDLIPEEFTFKLDPGTVIGGIVEDEGGQPIAGAQVEVRDQTAYRFHAIRPEELSPRPVRSYSLAEGDEAIITDAQGRWKLENVPADRDLVFDPADTADGLFGPPPEPREIELQVSHPAYSSYGFRGRSHQPRQEITLKSLRDQTAKIVLKKK